MPNHDVDVADISMDKSTIVEDFDDLLAWLSTSGFRVQYMSGSRCSIATINHPASSGVNPYSAGLISMVVSFLAVSFRKLDEDLGVIGSRYIYELMKAFRIGECRNLSIINTGERFAVWEY